MGEENTYPTFPVYGDFRSEDAAILLGLSEEKVALLQEQVGLNKLPERVITWYELLGKQFKGPMPGMIIVAIILTVLTQSWADTGVCSFMLLLNAFLGFNEERHAQKAALELKQQSKETVTAFRKDTASSVPTPRSLDAEDLVPGDIVYLKQGSKVPADCQWLFGAPAVCNEAALTGESVDVRRGGKESDVTARVQKKGSVEDTLCVELDGLRIVGLREGSPDGVHESEQRTITRVGATCVKNVHELLEAFASIRDDEFVSFTLSAKALLGGASIVKCTKCIALVERTGEQSMLGEAAKSATQGPSKGEFQLAIEFMVKCVIGSTLVIVTICFTWQLAVEHVSLRLAGLSAIALCIGSVPVALPVVLTVTQALGASAMARDKAIVTNLRAMQEIAVMQVLCSDKTGTLTTAQMAVYADKIVCVDTSVSPSQVLLYAALSSDRNNLEDPIDSAILRKLRTEFPEKGGEPANVMDKEVLKPYRVERFVGFSSETKRVCAFIENVQDGSKFMIGKGILSKVVNTRYAGNELGDPDDGVQWVCKNTTLKDVEHIDVNLSSHGFKTISVCIKKLDKFPDFSQLSEPHWLDHVSNEADFIGIIPMQDPPRHDSREVVQAIRELGVQVKMITGDHRNIAIETARQIALGDDIRDRKGLMVKGTKDISLRAVEAADGFAQVLPVDKARIVRTLQDNGTTAGMTGDGANDAAALGAANVGIAVKGAVDSARAASDILLTEGGLSPIRTAIIESRKIFQRLRSYVIYRVGHTIHVVLTLTHLILHHSVTIHPMYVIVMALFNDLAITMIGYDNAVPTKNPSVPRISSMLSLAFMMGFIQSIGSALLFETGLQWLIRGQDSSALVQGNEYIQTVMYLQMATTAGLLIFQARTPNFALRSDNPPGWPLVLAVSVPCTLASVMAGTGFFLRSAIDWSDVLAVWMFNIGVFAVIECFKIMMTYYFPEERSTDSVKGSSESLSHAERIGLLARQDSVRGNFTRRESGYGTYNV